MTLKINGKQLKDCCLAELIGRKNALEKQIEENHCFSRAAKNYLELINEELSARDLN